MLKIRRLVCVGGTDVDEINSLNRELSKKPKSVTSENLNGILAQSNFSLFFAEEDGGGNTVVLGMASIHFFGHLFGYIDDVVVHKNMQGGGRGKALVLKLLETAKDWPARKVFLTSGRGEDRVKANGLYQRSGFQLMERARVYRRYAKEGDVALSSFEWSPYVVKTLACPNGKALDTYMGLWSPKPLLIPAMITSAAKQSAHYLEVISLGVSPELEAAGFAVRDTNAYCYDSSEQA